MRLSFKIVVYMVGIIAFAVILLTYLTNAKFRSLQEEVERSRFLVLALDVKATAERGLALGLGLNQMNNLAAVLKRLHGEHPEILSLQIVSDRGEALYEVGAPPDAPDVAARLARLNARAAQDPRQPMDMADAGSGIYLALVNTFDQMVGALILHYDRQPSITAARAVTFDQLRSAGIALLAAAVAALALTSLYLRGVTGRFAQMTRLLEQPEQGDHPGARSDGLAARFAKMHASARELEADLARAEAALEQRTAAATVTTSNPAEP